MEDNQNTTSESSTEITKSVQARRKIFKDQPEAESKNAAVAENDAVEKTKPVKSASKTTVLDESLKVEEPEETMASPKPKKIRRGKWVWLGILILLLITAIGTGIGYWSAMKVRFAEEINQRIELATTQFVMAEQDQASGNLKMAQKRLEYVMTVYPEYPGLAEKLTEVMLAISLASPQIETTAATPEPVVTPVPTKDTGVVSVLYQQAENQLTATDWAGLLATVNQMRNIDPSYEPIKVDGMYYYALRYNGITKIKEGNLEVGLYYFAMAEKIAPLDLEVESYRTWAEMYAYAASWYGVNWYKSAEAFNNVCKELPAMIDTSRITAKQRYVDSLVGIGDLLMMEYKYCDAATQYEQAKDVISSDPLLLKIEQAKAYCANPPPTPTPTVDPNATPTPTPEN